jgi:hypothetical protein
VYHESDIAPLLQIKLYTGHPLLNEDSDLRSEDGAVEESGQR